MERESKIKIMSNGMNKEKTKNQTNPKNNPPAGGAGNQPEKKKNNACLPLAIVAIVIFLLAGVFLLIWMWPFIFSFFMDLRSGDFSLPKTFETGKGTLKGKNLASLIDPAKTITKRITAKDGGHVTAQTASGLYFTLNIGPGSLEKDTDISITPIEESPIENYPDPDDPGVVIGPPGTNLGNGSSVTVSEDPPAPEPDGSGAGPGTTGAGGGTTSTPPTTPPGTPPTTPPGIPPGTSGDIPDLGNLAGLFGNNLSTTTPSENPPSQGGTTGNTGTRGNDRNTDNGSPNGSSLGFPRFTDKTVIIFVGYGGGVSAVPTERSDDGDEISGPIDETGATSTDDPTGEESEDITDNAAANSGAASGGACTGEYIEALARTIATASAAGDTAAVSRYESEIRRCNSESANHLQYLCDNDPVRLRRKDFENRLALARALPASEGTASVIEWLMNDCQTRYHFYGEGFAPGSGEAGVTIFSSLDANVCGYVDDEWAGVQNYRISAEGGSHVFEGTTKFKLPSGGGQFSGTSHGTHSMIIIGRSVEVANFDIIFTGNFDGYKTINPLTLYPATVVAAGVPIETQERHCVPIAPLPR